MDWMDHAQKPFERGRSDGGAAARARAPIVTLIMTAAVLIFGLCAKASAFDFQAHYCNGQVYYPNVGKYRLECGQMIMHWAAQVIVHNQVQLATFGLLAFDHPPVAWNCVNIANIIQRTQVIARRNLPGANALLGKLYSIKADGQCP